jgi:hypothetical protein
MLRIRRAGDVAPYYEGEQNYVQFLGVRVLWVEVRGKELTVTTDDVCKVELIKGSDTPIGVELRARTS